VERRSTGSDARVPKWTKRVRDHTLFSDKSVLHSEPRPNVYGPLLVEIAKFFRTQVPPVHPEETLEIMAFIEAADMSKARGGASVQLSEVMR